MTAARAVEMRPNVAICFVARPDASGNGHELLLLRRAPGDYLAGVWSLAGGEVEPGETPTQAACRELKEEAGLVPEELYQLDGVEPFYVAAFDRLLIPARYVALVGREQRVVMDAEHDAFEWVAREAFVSRLLWRGERRAAAEMFEDVLDEGPARRHLRIELG